MITPITSNDLASIYTREFIELVRFPRSGKSHAVLDLAHAWKRLYPNNHLYGIDTENGLIKEWKKRPVDNFELWRCSSMDEVLFSFDAIRERKLDKQDWLIVESMSRIWGFAQDLGYGEIAGMSRSAYLSMRFEKMNSKEKVPPVTPDAGNLWQIVKNAHSRNFMDEIVKLECNVLLTTTLKLPGIERNTKEGSKIRESQARKDARLSIALDMGIEGEPRNPYYPDTILMMYREESGSYSCKVLGDRSWDSPDKNITFTVENFWFDFVEKCR